MSGDALKSILVSIEKRTVSREEIGKLVHFCTSAVKGYLYSHVISFSRLCLDNGITIDQLALDATAGFFRQGSSGNFIEIESFISSLPKDLDDINPSILLIKFQHRVIISAKDELSITYSKTDPTGAKISRNIKECVRKSGVLKIIKHFQKNYVEANSDEINEQLPLFPSHILEQELFATVPQKPHIPDILHSLFSVFTDHPNYRPSVAFNDLVQIVRKIYIPEDDQQLRFEEVTLTTEHIETIQRKVHRSLEEKLLINYVIKNKMSKDEAEVLSRALLEIMTAWWNGDGEPTSVAKIAQKHLRITQHEYKQEWQTVTEYFVRLAKEEFRNYLDNEFFF